MTRIHITQRDTRVLRDLASFRFMTAEALHALHFPSLDAAKERLRKLTRAGLTKKLFAPVRITGRVLEAAYALTRKGARVVEERTGEEVNHLPVREERSSVFLHHTLKRTAVRTCFELLARAGELQLGWHQREADVEVLDTDARRRRAAIPDGLVSLWHPGGCEVLLVEVDRGTVRPLAMERRYGIYARFAAEQRGGPGLPVKVLTIVPSERRLRRLQLAAERASDAGAECEFLFATYDEAVDLDAPEKLLGPVWRIGSGEDRHPLINSSTDEAS